MLLLVPVVLWGGLASCNRAALLSEVEPDEEFSGGRATVFNRSVNAFGLPAPGLTRQEERLFGVGNSFFNQNWVQSPASTTARDGLGPFFNARSCAGCHFKDGRGRAPEFDGESPTGYLVRVSVPGEVDAIGAPAGDPNYGKQVQNNAILDLQKEASVVLRYEELPGTYADGTPYSLRKPIVSFTDEAYGPLDGLAMSPRVANHMSGMGLLEAVPESTLRALADPDDLDGDGVSGRLNMVWNAAEGRATVGRFGWKANQPTLKQQVADAFHGDMGITTSIFMEENCTAAVPDCATQPNGGTPEIDEDDLDKVVLYSAALAVPARRDWEAPDVLRGKRYFREIGCESCHVSKLETGRSDIADVFSFQTIRPYTDLLLHDMGEGLADNRADFLATGREWRTPPLWGIGLFKTVNGHTNYLHDGRARNLAEAILWHGGEAEAAKEKFRHLDADERAAIIAFLESL
ncbi:MAG: di-heme oxidoredictase family protein [Bacteroidota bacterium]